MPFLLNDEEEKQQNQSGPQNISGQSSVINQPGQNQGQQKSSGSYTNLQTYLDANKEQAGQMGQNIVQGVESTAQQANKNINKFKQDNSQQTAQLNEDQIRQSLQKPTENVDQYRTLRTTGGYQGPQSVDQAQGYQEAMKTGQQASEKVKKIDSEEGRNQLVSEQYTRPQYTTGQRKLDTYLVSKDPNARSGLENTFQRWNNLDNLLNTAVSDVGNTINQNIQNATQNKGLIADTENKVKQEYISDLQNKANEFNKNREREIAGFIQNINKGTIDSRMIDEFGLDLGTKLYNTDLASYISPDYTQATASSMMDQNQRDYWKNLNSLLGIEDNSLDINAARPSDQIIDKSRLQQDLATRAKDFEEWARGQTFNIRDSSSVTDDNLQAMIREGNENNLWDYLNKGTSAINYVGAPVIGAPDASSVWGNSYYPGVEDEPDQNWKRDPVMLDQAIWNKFSKDVIDRGWLNTFGVKKAPGANAISGDGKGIKTPLDEILGV